MAKQYDQLKKMREKADRLKEKARQAGSSRMTEKYLQQAENVLASVQAIIENWKRFGEREKGNTNFKGARHTQQARQKMSEMRKAFWQSKPGFEKMWRARRRRQYQENGKCPLRFPRLGVSNTDQEWLDTYRDRYL